jgi:hypothetical protein
MKQLILSCLALLPLVSGCAAVIGVGAGLIISQEMLDNNTFVTHLNSPVSKVWPTCKSTLSESSLGLVDFDDQLRVARAKVDGATVTVACEAYDNDKTIMRVMARRYGLNAGETAQTVQDKILQALQH